MIAESQHVSLQSSQKQGKYKELVANVTQCNIVTYVIYMFHHTLYGDFDK